MTSVGGATVQWAELASYAGNTAGYALVLQACKTGQEVPVCDAYDLSGRGLRTPGQQGI